jgi:hypothetical protein
LLISSLGKPCKSYSSRSGSCFLHERTRITGFIEDYAQDMSKDGDVSLVLHMVTALLMREAIVVSSFLPCVAKHIWCD